MEGKTWTQVVSPEITYNKRTVPRVRIITKEPSLVLGIAAWDMRQGKLVAGRAWVPTQPELLSIK